MHGKGGNAWDTMRYGDTINERAVRILLECILVLFCDNLKHVPSIIILISESDYSKNYQALTIPLHIPELHVTHD